MHSPTLKTQRLILRQFMVEDIDSIFFIFKDKSPTQFMPWFPLQTKEEAILYFQEYYQKEYKKEQGYHYAICLKETNTPIGYLNLSLDESYELTFGLLKEYWQNGYMSEAINALISQAQSDGIPYITATHNTNNPRSGNVMKNVGMVYCYSYEEPWDHQSIYRVYQINLHKDRNYIYKGYWRRFPNHFIETSY